MQERKNIFAKRTINYDTNANMQIKQYTATELNKKTEGVISLLLVIKILFPPPVIFFFLGLILIFVYPQSKKIQDFLNLTNWNKIFAYSIKFAIVFLPSLRYKLLLPFSDELVYDADLNKFNQEEYFDKSLVVNLFESKEVQPEIISISLKRIEGVILLKGESGLGKTMFIKNLLKNSLKELQKTKNIPVFLPANQCKKGVIETIKLKLEDSIVGGKKEIKKMIKNKTLTVIVDGLNEVEADTREEISNFIKKCRNGNILISTQLIRWEPPPNTKIYKLLPLQKEQIEDFLLNCRYSYNEEINRSGVNYIETCKQWISGIKEKISIPEINRILSNPMDLNTVASLLARGDKPKNIDLFNLQLQQYKIIAKEYKEQNNGLDFRLNSLSDSIYDWVSETEDPFLPEDIIIKFEPEITIMKDFRLLINQDKRWYFRHDRVKVFFLVQAFIKNKHWGKRDNFKIVRFYDVFLELVRQLPQKDIIKLGGLLLSYAADYNDHNLSDEFIKHLRERPDFQISSIF